MHDALFCVVLSQYFTAERAGNQLRKSAHVERASVQTADRSARVKANRAARRQELCGAALAEADTSRLS